MARIIAFSIIILTHGGLSNVMGNACESFHARYSVNYLNHGQQSQGKLTLK